jgi:hypothetical protein
MGTIRGITEKAGIGPALCGKMAHVNSLLKSAPFERSFDRTIANTPMAENRGKLAM